MMYYDNKLETLKEIFGTAEISLKTDCLLAGSKRFPIVDDVIILSEEEFHTPFVKEKLRLANRLSALKDSSFAESIQYSFGQEWENYAKILPEHKKEFSQYFDLVDLDSLNNKRVCDLGCGSGRWSYFLQNRCREIILLDFSDAIFVARKNLKGAENCLFFMCDLLKMPFKDGFCDLLFSLGVLHHLPVPCLNVVRSLKNKAPQLNIFLYYALDNRPFYFRIILKVVTFLRRILSKVRNEFIRKIVSKIGTYFIYMPLISLGRLLKPFKLASHVPLYDFYHAKTFERIEQDVYDRFFTSIEQRVTRKQISELSDTFSAVTISNNLPYWHFICKK